MRGLILVIALSAVAYADPIDEARQHFQEGLRFYDQGKWADAVGEFEAAKKLHPSAQLDYNIARAYDRMGDWQHALDGYRRYIDAEAFAADASAVRTRIEELKLKLKPAGPEPGLVRVDSTPSADVRVDDERGEVLGATPLSLQLPAGAHVVYLRQAGWLPISKGFTVGKGETVQLQLSLLPEPKIAEKKSRAWISGPIFGAVGVVAIVALITMGVLSDGFTHEFGAAHTSVFPVVK
jgi:tetratricopeptide (TPR) repeat protein